MAGEKVTIRISVDKLLYAAIAVVVAGLIALNVYAFFIKGDAAPSPVQNTPENFNAFKGAENPEDKCATPEGYTEEEWREHLGHHPDQYAECLQ